MFQSQLGTVRKYSEMNPQSKQAVLQTKKLFLRTSEVLAKTELPKTTKDKVENVANKAGQNAQKLLTKTSTMVQNYGPMQQLIIGSISGWCTGFLATRVGKTVAISFGGSILLITAATQTGYVSINWDKIQSTTNQVTEKVSETASKGMKSPQAISLSRFAKTNVYLAAGFVGGLLLGITY